MVGAARAVHNTGGLWLLWTPGLQATWLRAFSVTGLRVGLYPTVRDVVGGGDSFAKKAGAGMLTGALSAAAANPIDMVRTRIHAQVGLSTLRYETYAAAARDVVANEGGVAALWRGLGATVARQMLLSGGQLASYDQAKQTARESFGIKETPALHLVCAAFSGAVAQFVCMPACVPRTRPFRARVSASHLSRATANHLPAFACVSRLRSDVIKVKILSGDHGTSMLACLRATLTQEGVTGLYRGFLPAVTRQCPVILVQMPLIEQVRKLAGLGHM